MTLRSCSYGGGLQSTSLLVKAAEGEIDYPLFLFANTGDDSEHPETLRYVREVAIPYGAAHGIEVVEIRKQPNQRGRFKGEVETLMGRLMHPDSRSLPIPVRMTNGAPGKRSCTADFKIRVIEKELKRRGATADDPAIVALGISMDELHRASPGLDPRSEVQIRTYPMLVRSPLDPYSDDLRLSRDQCPAIIAKAGLPVPGKSACFFCPFHDQEQWRALKRNWPALFEKACELDEMLAARRELLGKDRVFLHKFLRPLRDAVDDQGTFEGMDGCDSGYCMT